MTHTTGTPAWIDLMTTDRQGAMAFYGAVFGWQYEQQRDATQTYAIARHDGRDAAGIADRSEAEIAQGIPPAWNLFFATEDIDATVTRAAELGARVLNGPFDAMDAGRMAVLTDPTGALFCLWQATGHDGLGVMHVPGALTWVECLTTDPATAIRFYEQLFAWKTETSDDLGTEYTLCHTDGTPTAGIMAMPSELVNVASNWMVYFETHSTDATIKLVQQHGGTLLNGPMEYGTGEFAVIADPQGAVFGIIEPLA